MQKFKSVESLVNQLKPEKPVYCIRKNSIKSAVKYFQKRFLGKILYAVKTNPHPEVIKTIIENGVKQFDVASLGFPGFSGLFLASPAFPCPSPPPPQLHQL